MRVLHVVWILGLLAGCAAPENRGDAPTYPELRDSPIRGLTPDEIASLENGTGAGLALPAELNGYAGPKHVLELKERLGLNASQAGLTQELFDRTQGQAKQAGRHVLDAYRALDQAYRNQTVDEQSLPVLLDAIAGAEAALRGVHLRAHLEMNALLTPHQRALYVELRGYGAAEHTGHH